MSVEWKRVKKREYCSFSLGVVTFASINCMPKHDSGVLVVWDSEFADYMKCFSNAGTIQDMLDFRRRYYEI